MSPVGSPRASRGARGPTLVTCGYACSPTRPAAAEPPSRSDLVGSGIELRRFDRAAESRWLPAERWSAGRPGCEERSFCKSRSSARSPDSPRRNSPRTRVQSSPNSSASMLPTARSTRKRVGEPGTRAGRPPTRANAVSSRSRMLPMTAHPRLAVSSSPRAATARQT
jgi:hypothetical protein